MRALREVGGWEEQGLQVDVPPELRYELDEVSDSASHTRLCLCLQKRIVLVPVLEVGVVAAALHEAVGLAELGVKPVPKNKTTKAQGKVKVKQTSQQTNKSPTCGVRSLHPCPGASCGYGMNISKLIRGNSRANCQIFTLGSVSSGPSRSYRGESESIKISVG